MHEYLIQSARDEIWCNPLQDNQHIFKPARVTPNGGGYMSTQFLERDIALPWPKDATHLFQIGQISPGILGLLEREPSWSKEKWLPLTKAMYDLGLYADIYNETGIQIPRSLVYFKFTRERCLVFAIKQDARIPVNLGTENIYIRLYTNAYLLTQSNDNLKPFVEVITYEPSSIGAIGTMESEWRRIAARKGACQAYVNGNWVSELSDKTVKIGDIAEIVHEVSVKRTVAWKVRTLKPFTSRLDSGKSKLILHYNKANQSTVIDFNDDVDLYVAAKLSNGAKIGRYYVRNQVGAMRQLTHRDYSVAADYVEFISRAVANLVNTQTVDILDFEIIAKIREGGYKRTLVNDGNRIKDLYRLSDTRIIQAMSGVDSVPEVWHAATLEESAYTKVMRSLQNDITISDAEKAYGYYTAANKLGEVTLKPSMVGALPVFKLKEGQVKLSTVYEYDGVGRILGSYLHNSNDDDYEARNNNCRLAEVIIGRGTMTPSVYFGQGSVSFTQGHDFRVYACALDFSKTPAVPDEKWVDITDNREEYKVVGDVLTYTGIDSDKYLMVRTNETFLAYNFSAIQKNGTLIFTLQETNRMGGVSKQRPVPVPPGDLKIWMNGEELVQGIDFIVKWPVISINNYKHVRQPAKSASQDFMVRASGFCSSSLELPSPDEVGFLENGALSNEDPFKWNLHDDRSQHVSIGGRLYHKNDVVFAENFPAWSPRDLRNGQPYQITTNVIKTTPYTQRFTYDLLTEAKAIDSQVRAYLQLYASKPVNQPVSVMPERWRLVSPFFSFLISAAESDLFQFADTDIFDEAKTREICKPFEYLLDYDPIFPDNGLSESYINVTPIREQSQVTVRRVNYRFLLEAVKLYGGGRIGLNNFVRFNN